MIEKTIEYILENSLVMSFLFVGIVMGVAEIISKKLLHGRIHASAIGIIIGLFAAYIGGVMSDGANGIADIALFSGVGVLGSPMLRDFAVISTSFGADLENLKKGGEPGCIALIFGVVISFSAGCCIAMAFGYTDPEMITVLGAGTVTFIVGSVTASSLGVTGEIVAISIAAGVIKSIMIMIATPFVAKKIGLTTPKAAMIFGALMGSTSGVSAGLAATDQKLVPYGAMMATFYLGAGCLLCPTVLHAIVCLLSA